MLPLSRGEATRFAHYPESLNETLITGGYPRILDRGLDPPKWIGSYISTDIERDVRTLRNVGDLSAFGRFVQLCAGRTAQLANLSALADDCGVSQPTADALPACRGSSVRPCLRPYSGSMVPGDSSLEARCHASINSDSRSTAQRMTRRV